MRMYCNHTNHEKKLHKINKIIFFIFYLHIYNIPFLCLHFYNKDRLSVFTSEEDFDIDFLRDFDKPDCSDENYSADTLLKFIKSSIF